MENVLKKLSSIKTYNTYQEAKIANPDSDIYHHPKGWFFAKENANDDYLISHKCTPADHCITVADLFAKGLQLHHGDKYQDGINVFTADDNDDGLDEAGDGDEGIYVLRAKALELELNDSEIPNGSEWSGEGLPPVGVECEILFKEYRHKGFGLFRILGYKNEYVWVQFLGPKSNHGKCYTSKFSTLEFRKPETTEEREKRERLEAAYDLYLEYRLDTPVDFASFQSAGIKKRFLRIVDKTNYRKEK